MAYQSPGLDLVFKALADPTRRAVLARLGDGPASVGALAEPFDMALPSFMQHLRVLERAGLVSSTKIGRVRTCTLRPEALGGAERWLADQRAMWSGRLDRLEAYLEETLDTDGEDDG
jgi:DNA-binding transcriptional ArsR family regulator